MAAFVKINDKLTSSPFLRASDFEKTFKLIVDATDIYAGGVLLQEHANGMLLFEDIWQAREKLLYIWEICPCFDYFFQHFEVYLGTNIQVFTVQNILTFLHEMKNKNQRLVRWSLFLQDLIIEIKHIMGKDNVIVDSLPWISLDKDTNAVLLIIQVECSLSFNFILEIAHFKVHLKRSDCKITKH